MTCVVSAPRHLAALTVAASLAASPGSANAAEQPATCPGVASGDSDETQFRRCVEAARASDERSRALHSRAALKLGRRLYLAGREGAGLDWLEGHGDLLVHYGTESCESALTLDPAGAVAMLNACIDLLGAHFLDLSRAGASNATAAEETAKRRATLTALRDRLVVRTAPTGPPPPLDGSPPTPATDVAPPEQPVASSDPGTTSAPGDRPPARALLAGVGVSGGVLLVSAVGLGLSWSAGQRAYEKIQQPMSVAPADVGRPICDIDPRSLGCAEHVRAQRLFIASSVGLAAAAVAATVFGGLLVRHRLRSGQSRTTAFVTPTRAGFASGFALQF